MNIRFKRPMLLVGVFFLTLSCFLLAVALAQSQPKRGGTVKVGLNTDVDGVDPHVTPAHITTIVMNHIFEPLVGYSEDLDVIPVLAEKWDVTPDLKTYTFFLLKGKLFHNHREMVADDVKYSIERIMDPKTQNNRRSNFNKVERIEVVDKYTVRFRMKESDANLLHSLAEIPAIMAIVPREEVEKQGGVMKHPVGTGPYKFVEWKQGRHLILERFDDYVPQPGPMNGFGGKRVAYIDKIRFVPVPEESVATMALLNKEIDFLLFVPFKNADKFKTDYKKLGIVTDESPGMSLYQIFFGMKNPVTKDLNFRKACAYAIDRNLVAEAAMRGYQTDNASFVAVGNPYFTPNHKKWYKKDVETAKKLLKESGYKGEQVTIITNKQYQMMYTQAVAVQSELAAVGINTKLEVLDWPTAMQYWFNGNFQILSYGLAPRPDPRLAFSSLKSSGFYDLVPRMKEIEDETSKTLNFDTRKKLFEEAHALVYENVPSIVFYSRNYLNAYWNYLKGFKIATTDQPRFWNAWLEN
jgi:peptide/nickel transport system substrate-binding protein